MRPKARTLLLPVLLGLAAVFAASALAAAPATTAPPTIVGQAQQGKTLTATNGTWSNGPTTVTYQWQRCNADGSTCTAIAGASRKTYLVTAADVEHALRVLVTASNADGTATATSNPTEVVSSSTEPRNTARPTVSGTAQVGEELVADPGTWTGGVRAFSYQWQRCDQDGANCVDVTGAGGKTYGVRSADVDHTLRVSVTATNLAGSATVTSDRSRVVVSDQPAPAPAPAPGPNERPQVAFVSARFVGARLYARMRVCDDSRSSATIVETDSKPGVASYTRRFATITAPVPCRVYSRSWVPAPRFRHGRLTVTIWARDKSGKTSAPARKVFVRR
jgi:hypothetical protein